jgi:16S rRNA (uracil1498-N3)-methyltransferase
VARRRFFVPEIIHGTAELLGDDAHHLARVLRVEAGQQFEISDRHRACLAEITDVSKSSVRFRVIEELESSPELPPVTLYAALFKFDRFEWMIEKATEIGVARIVPVETARSENGLLAAAAKRVERWRKIALESSQQSRRLAPPEVSDPKKLAAALADAAAGPPADHRYRLEEQPGSALLIDALPTDRSPVTLLIGPEGGWVDSERAALDAAAGWLAVSLGPSILRAETAAIVAASIAAHCWLSARNA